MRYGSALCTFINMQLKANVNRRHSRDFHIGFDKASVGLSVSVWHQRVLSVLPQRMPWRRDCTSTPAVPNADLR